MASKESDSKERHKFLGFMNLAIAVGILAVGADFLGHIFHGIIGHPKR